MTLTFQEYFVAKQCWSKRPGVAEQHDWSEGKTGVKVASDPVA